MYTNTFLYVQRRLDAVFEHKFKGHVPTFNRLHPAPNAKETPEIVTRANPRGLQLGQDLPQRAILPTTTTRAVQFPSPFRPGKVLSQHHIQSPQIHPPYSVATPCLCLQGSLPE
jgi:hypothetical protein